jgi:hypothetical protein
LTPDPRDRDRLEPLPPQPQREGFAATIDKSKHRWANGKPFNFQAGFDGDERSYNNEDCVYDRNYNGPAPYQFLYAMFSYSCCRRRRANRGVQDHTHAAAGAGEKPAGEDIFTESIR